MGLKNFFMGDAFADQKMYEKIARQEAKKERAIQSGIESYKMYSGQTQGKQVSAFEKKLRSQQHEKKESNTLFKVNQGFATFDKMFGVQPSKKYETDQKIKQRPVSKPTPSFFSAPFYEKPKSKPKRRKVATRTVYIQVATTKKRRKSAGPTRKYIPGFGYV